MSAGGGVYLRFRQLQGARDGLIAPQNYTPPPGEVIIEWEITKAGRAHLRDLDEADVATGAAS